MYHPRPRTQNRLRYDAHVRVLYVSRFLIIFTKRSSYPPVRLVGCDAWQARGIRE
jgi:hypothetical protein